MCSVRSFGMCLLMCLVKSESAVDVGGIYRRRIRGLRWTQAVIHSV
jgi:hypothetical protein